MARKHKHPEHVNHERWLVSYADFITLLFAFFVVMFAVSQVDSKKVGRFSESFQQALESNTFNSKGKGLLPGEVQPVSRSTSEMKMDVSKHRHAGMFSGEKAQIRRALTKRASATPALTGLRILDIHGELVVRLPERLIFAVGEAQIQPDGVTALHIISDELAQHRVRVRIEGHTDNAPIRTARFPSNWELSTARATAVVAFLIETKKLDPVRLSAAGYGEYHPVAENESTEGRSMNRRVDIVVVTDELPTEPAEPEAQDAPQEPTK